MQKQEKSNGIYWFNIRGALDTYRDVEGAKTWLMRADRELSPEQVTGLVNSMQKWLLHSDNAVDLGERILQLLSEVDLSGDFARRSQFAKALPRILLAKHAKDEDVRLGRLRIQSEKQAKVEREHAEALKRQKEEVERRKREELKKLIVEKRDAFLEQIRNQLRCDFLSADVIFHSSPMEEVSQAEYDEEKISFVKSWIVESMPSDKHGNKRLPDDQQTSAIAAVNGHVQLIARAGSGKTTTLVNRTLFLLKHCGVAPSQMLLLAFNRKAVLEIRRRLLGLLSDGAEASVVEEVNRRRLEAVKKNRNALEDIESSTIDLIAAERNVALPYIMTFHALARSIANFEGTILFDEPESDVQGLSRVFQNVIDDHLQLPEFHHRIRLLMLAHFREDWDRIVDGGFDQTKDELLKFRRSLPRESLGGDYVKSYGEKVIADFLFEHDIAYKYERNHWWSGINYRPDFTIFMSEKRGHENGLIIEYFGLAGDAGYDEMSVAKQKYWAAKKDWSLVEFTPIDITGNGVEAFRLQLQARLEKLGVKCVRLSENEIWHRIRERAVDRFTKSIVGFIGRCRKLSWSPDELYAHIDTHVAQSPVEAMFLPLAHHLYTAYLNQLSATVEDDFDGLMQRASKNINSGQTAFLRKSGNGDLNALRYICIDEYQDFSDLFFQLLSAIRKQNPGVELFCVGDDWQAINGFAGSDLQFFQDFKEYFGESRKLHISINFRSSRAIVDIGNALMHGLGQPSVANKKSVGKVLLSDLNQFEPTLLEKQRHPGDSLTPAVLRVANQALVDGVDVVLLCRRNGLPYFVNYGQSSGAEGRGIDRFLRHVRSFFPGDMRERITISTAHKYKGLEKSVVIVLDAVKRSYPLIHPDWVFARIFGDSPAKITQEERRLFYVALTRAIDTLVVFTEGHAKSPFLDDIERHVNLMKLDWAVFPAVTSMSGNRLVVRVKSQPNALFAIGTFSVKDQLKACRYNWHSINEVWEKSFPVSNFNFDLVRNEVWATATCRVEIAVVDDCESELASYGLDLGAWSCRFDNIGIARESSDAAPLKAVK